MITKKTILFATLFLSHALLNASPAQETINEKAISHQVHALFYPNCSSQEAEAIARKIAPQVIKIANRCSYFYGIPYGCSYSDEKAQEAVYNLLVTHIEDRARHLARQSHLPAATVEKIAQTIGKEVIKKMTDMDELHGALSEFVDPLLREKIERIKGRFAPQAVTQEARIYPSTNCCACTDPFSDSKKPIYASCGHPMCIDCSCTWYADHDTCPLCVQVIDKEALQNALVD